MLIEEFEPENAIILEGELGDKFYIIYNGRVAVFKNTKVEDNSVDRGFKIVARQLTELSNGDSFGEVALMHDAPRSASVIATELTHCIVLTQETYVKVVMNLHSYQIKGTADFFQSHPLLSSLDRKRLE